MTEKKIERRRVVAAVAAYAFLIVLSIVFLWNRRLYNLKPAYIMNVACDIFGMSIGYVLYISCLIDVKRMGVEQRFFLILLNVTFMGLFTDACAWMVDGIPALRILNLLDNMFYYMCGSIGAVVFWFYMVSWFRTERRSIRIISTVFQISLAVSLLLIFMSLFTGHYFTVDADGVYARGPYSALSTVYASLVMLITLLVAFLARKKLAFYQLVAVFLYALAPVAAAMLSVFVYGLSLTYAAVMLVIVLMYCVLTITQSRSRAVADRDLAIATAIQEGMLPTDFSSVTDRLPADICASMHAAKEVGGDFYDFFMTDDDHLGFVIGDVSGKGVPASLFMAVTKTLIKDHVLLTGTPAEAMTQVNERLCENNPRDLFVTCWLGVLDCKTGRLTYVNAGHNAPVFLRADGEAFYLQETVEPQFMLAGFPGFEYEQEEITLNPGDAVYLYTDGVTEAKNEEDAFFGEERLLALMNELSDRKPGSVVEAVGSRVAVFRGKAEQFDDITMLQVMFDKPAD
ncbi:MAG: serine/threonine-protein phosphatase [Lachnospiraceae bacterium]|nr:serine/threonine-protein phosphatase [Lachnospiraceae bacterium]